MPDVDTVVPVPVERARLVVEQVLVALGVVAADAAVVADVLLEADLTGVDSHGIHLLLMYADRLRSGAIDPVGAIEVLDDEGTTVWLDAHLGMGQTAGRRAVDLLVERTREHGVAVVSVREATHLGALGVYTRRAAVAGVVCLCVQNGPTVVPPYGGRTALFSTNPVSYGIPAGTHPPIVYDIATTAVAGNKLLLAKKRGDATIPEGWACDTDGRPTTDTEAASVWNLQWFGGHKGYGLGLLVEVLAGVLAGSSYGRTEHSASDITGRQRVAKGFTFVGIAPGRFVGAEEFARRTDELIDDIVGSEVAADAERIVVPGQLEEERRAERLRDGLPLSANLVDEIDAVATSLGVTTLR